MYFNFTIQNKPCTFISLLMSVFLLTACGNSDDADKVKEALELNLLNISSIIVESDNSIIEFDATEQFAAIAVIGEDTEGSLDISDKVTWAISDSSIASITNTGLLTGKADGLVTVRVSFADLSASKELQLSSASLESIAITNGASTVSVCASGYNLTAQGTYSDATTRNITRLVDWSSSSETLAEIDNEGAFSTYQDGNVTFSATRDSITGNLAVDILDDLDSINIEAPSTSVFVNKTLAFIATGEYDDTSTRTITSNLTWSSSDTSHLTISNEDSTIGLARGVSDGSATVTASCNNSAATVSNEIEIAVSTEPTIDGVEIEENLNILRFRISESPEQLSAKLTFSNDTEGDDVSDSRFSTWSILDADTARVPTINSEGLLTFSEEGEFKVKIRYYDNEDLVGPFEDEINIEILAN